MITNTALEPTNISDLRIRLARLDKLLQEPHPESITWRLDYDRAVEHLQDFWNDKRDKDAKCPVAASNIPCEEPGCKKNADLIINHRAICREHRDEA